MTCPLCARAIAADHPSINGLTICPHCLRTLRHVTTQDLAEPPADIEAAYVPVEKTDHIPGDVAGQLLQLRARLRPTSQVERTGKR
jgi:glutaredoxin